MNNRRLLVLVAFGFGLLDGATADAQQPPRIRRPVPAQNQPVVSPYLNLVRGRRGGAGRGAAFNYFTLVRPQLQFRAAMQQQAQELRDLNAEVQEQQGQVSDTGHVSQFMNYSHFFPLFGGGGGAARTRTQAAPVTFSAPQTGRRR